MLKYNIKLNDSSVEKKELVWGEKYLSPDLSYVSGTCDTAYHLEYCSELPVSSEINNSAATIKVEAHNEKRLGYIVLYNKKIKEESGKYTHFSGNTKSSISYKYININDRYFYPYYNGSGYAIDNVLHYSESLNDVTTEDLIVYPQNGYITYNAAYYIDDSKVTIDGIVFTFDSATEKLYWNNKVVATTSITTTLECSEYKIVTYPSNKVKEYTKFVLTKDEEYQEKETEKVTYCKPFYYIEFKDNYCYVSEKTDSNGTVTGFTCNIPQGLIDGLSINKDDFDTEEEYAAAQQIIEYKLYFVPGFTVYDINDYSSRFGKDEIDVFPTELTIETLNNAGIYNVTDLYSLNNINCFVKIDDYYYIVQNSITNSNSGKQLLVSLTDSNNGLNDNDLLVVSYKETDNNIMLPIYNNGDNDFVIYDGDRYLVQKNLCDKLIMLGEEYDINYVNGKVTNADCYVTVDGEDIMMQIVNTNGGTYGSGVLKRYGKTVGSSAAAASESTYDIYSYDGVIIKDNVYQRYDNAIALTDDVSLDFELLIKKSIGSSSFVCKPVTDEELLSTVLKDTIETDICDTIINNLDKCTFNIKNKIFGNSPITPDLAFSQVSEPLSSNDYYNLFDDLKLYVNTNYIMVPLGISFHSGGYAMQDDLIESDFYEYEKEKAINDITDMEKDIYLPKYISSNSGKYDGCDTVFKHITDLKFNLHFRTRNLDTWKVNESTNRYDVKNYTDNWFITDTHPYKDVISSKYKELMNLSDLMGLLYFTNDDVYYQRSKISKSFLRLSFYDSTDTQTQTLLSTATVFMNGHTLYKTFVDNSRKYVNDYGKIALPEFKTNDSGYIITGTDQSEAAKLNKISVMTEYLGERSRNTDDYSWKQLGKLQIENDEHRLSSRLTVTNKYNTDYSSEGFYAYMYKDFATKLHPRRMFLKIEFNHAGVGKTIEFNIPMKWEKSSKANSLKYYPTSKYTLSPSDLSELKKGITVDMKEAQSYIPVYAVYDFINKEYAYVFDSRYVSIDNGSAYINLFEPKFQDESSSTVSEGQRQQLTKGESNQYVININTSQFKEEDFN